MKTSIYRILKDILKYKILGRKSDIHNSLLFLSLKPGTLAIDCGAHIGEATEKMLNRGATVIGFEPNPHACQAYRENYGDHPNLTILPKAVWTEKSKLRLYLHQNSDEDEVHWATGSSLLDTKANINREKWIEVEAVDFIHFLQELDQPVTLIKMDIEGAECEVLEKLLDHGWHKKIGKILVETHDDKIPELKERTDQLRARLKEEKIRNVILDWI